MIKLLTLAVCLLLPHVVYPVFIDPGIYRLSNHSSTEAEPLPYGLRFTEMMDVYNFSFDEPGADVFLDYDGVDIRIHGKVWGGVEVGGSYNAPKFWEMDLYYNNQIAAAAGDDDLIVQAGAGHTATVTRMSDSLEVTLSDYEGGVEYVLRLGDDDDDLGFEGVEGLSGWGWLHHPLSSTATEPELKFSAVAIPEPKIYLMLGGFLIFVAAAKRQRDLQRIARKRIAL